MSVCTRRWVCLFAASRSQFISIYTKGMKRGGKEHLPWISYQHIVGTILNGFSECAPNGLFGNNIKRNVSKHAMYGKLRFVSSSFSSSLLVAVCSFLCCLFTHNLPKHFWMFVWYTERLRFCRFSLLVDFSVAVSTKRKREATETRQPIFRN